MKKVEIKTMVNLDLREEKYIGKQNRQYGIWKILNIVRVEFQILLERKII